MALPVRKGDFDGAATLEIDADDLGLDQTDPGGGELGANLGVQIARFAR